VLARSRRSATFATGPGVPWRDQIPRAQVSFRRGLIHRARLDGPAYLRAPAKRWRTVPLEELLLKSDGTPLGEPLAARPELARLRLLGLSGHWPPAELRPLLTECPHLAGLRGLYLDSIGDGEPPFALGGPVHLPAVDTLFAGHVDGEDALTFLRGFTNPLQRLVLQNTNRDLNIMEWLGESPHRSSLRQFSVWHPEQHTYAISYSTPTLPDIGHYLSASMEDLRLSDHQLGELVAIRSWGKVRTLRLSSPCFTHELAVLARTRQSSQLRRLFFEFTDDVEELVGDRLGDIFSCGPHLANIRHLRMDLMYCRENIVPGIVTGPYREGLLRLDLHGMEGGGVAFEAQEMAELLARPWPELRTLCIDVTTTEKVHGMTPLLTTPNLPNLCTLWTCATLPRSMINALARAKNLPHLSLIVDAAGGDWRGREWVVGSGVARRVAPKVRLLEADLLDAPAW
jgi:hypothetical protein